MIVLSGIILVPNAFAENVPEWVKNTAGWWATDAISETEFVNAVEFLVKENIIHVNVSQAPETSQSVPDWVKNTAGWWAEDAISETDFVNAIEYLIKHGIITVNENSSCVNDLSEIFGDSIAMVQDTCDLHESSEYSELVPFIEKSNFNSLGFRGTEFSEVKPPNTYRIFMVGGSTLFGSGESSDNTTIPSILQKIFDSDDSTIQKVEVINAGFGGANSNLELNLIKQKLVYYQPDLVVVYDGWNDLKADYPVKKIADYWKGMCDFSKENNFDIVISLQPITGFGNKKLTQQEFVNSLTGEDHNGFQLIAAKSTYDYMGRELLSLEYSHNCNVIDLRGIFDNINGPIYWDQGHISDTGNLIQAEKFYEIVTESFFSKRASEDKFHKIISKYNNPIITSYLLSKIGIDVDYTQIQKQDLAEKDKRTGNYFYLKNKLGGSEKILVGKDLSKTDLSKIDLTGQDLSGVNLSGQDLRKIDFTGTILRGANLSFTDLSGQDLSGMDLRGINFHNANLENADLSNITISKLVQYLDEPKCSYPSDIFLNNIFANKCVIEVLQNELVRTDFSNANLRGATISTNFMNFVDFSDVDMTGIKLSGFAVGGCKFNGANLHNSTMNRMVFLSCDFSDTKFTNSKVFNTVFQDVSFHNTKITDGHFESILFIDTDISNADLKDTTFSNIVWSGDNNRTCKNHQICD